MHAIIELDAGADAQAIADGMGDFLKERLSRYKHPESFEVVSVSLRDDSGKVRRTLLRDERNDNDNGRAAASARSTAASPPTPASSTATSRP